MRDWTVCSTALMAYRESCDGSTISANVSQPSSAWSIIRFTLARVRADCFGSPPKTAKSRANFLCQRYRKVGILVGDSVLYVLLEDGHAGYFISTDINLSHILWTQKAEREWSSEWPRLWNRMLLVGNCRGEFTAFRSSDGAPQWSDKLKGCIRSIGTDGDAGDIFIGVQEGTVYAYSPPQIHNQPQGK